MKYMKMAIDKAIDIMECYEMYGFNSQRDGRNKAIDTMRKYQNLQNKLDQLEHEMECVLESDTRTMINRESEDGWLFDKIIRWRKIISEVVENDD